MPGVSFPVKTATRHCQTTNNRSTSNHLKIAAITPTQKPRVPVFYTAETNNKKPAKTLTS